MQIYIAIIIIAVIILIVFIPLWLKNRWTARKRDRTIIDLYDCDFQTGDLILFSGTAKLSFLLTNVFGDEFSHVGIVYRNRDGKLFIIEAVPTYALKWDHHDGVKITPLYERILTYNGYLCWRKLRSHPHIVERFDNLVERLSNEHKLYKFTDPDWKSLFAFYMQHSDHDTIHNAYVVHCALFATKCLMFVGIVPANKYKYRYFIRPQHYAEFVSGDHTEFASGGKTSTYDQLIEIKRDETQRRNLLDMLNGNITYDGHTTAE